MESIATSVPPDQMEPTPVIDVRDIPLERLLAEAGVSRNVTGVIRGMEGPSRVRVAMFNSAV